MSKLSEQLENAPIVYDKNYSLIKDYQSVVDAFAIGFAFYLSDNYISRTLDTWDDAAGIRFTSKQVLEIYKKENGL